MTDLYVSCMFLFHNRSFNHALHIKMWHKTTCIMGKVILVIQFQQQGIHFQLQHDKLAGMKIQILAE